MSNRSDDRLAHVPSLDGVRAIAAYCVIATHAGFNSGRSLDDGPFAPVLARLDFGVTLFFLLSGYLLFQPYVAAEVAGTARPNVASFWWRRVLRILPAYWMAVTFTLLLLSTRRARGDDWWSYLVLVQTYNGHNVDPSLTQMWTLAVEIAFYAVLPFLGVIGAHLSGKRSAVAGQLRLIGGLMLAGLLGNLIARAISGDASTGLLWLPAYLDWFGLGMFLALARCVAAEGHPWRRTLGAWASAPGTCWVIGALLFWSATLPLAGPRTLVPASGWEWTIRHYLYGGAAFFFLLPIMLAEAGWIRRILGNTVARWLGAISYGVYLWHLALLLAIQRWLGWRTFGGHFTELFLLAAICSTVVAGLSWHLIERPLLRRFSHPWRTKAQPSKDENAQRQQANDLHPTAATERVG
jgi:peptidoglycan/LPS O-acetylase OafA/YrhL